MGVQGDITEQVGFLHGCKSVGDNTTLKRQTSSKIGGILCANEFGQLS
jgi:hypothetical protein